MTVTELFLVAMILIFAVPYAIWRLARTDYYAPLVVVQIIAGILLGPGVLGAVFPQYYETVFTPSVVQALNGIAWWAVMLFVWIAGIELDLTAAWRHRRETAITAGLALGSPLLLGALAAVAILAFPGWIGSEAQPWQFIAGVGMACAVTALPILILLMEKMGILREPIGQRILRYASMDDIAIWAVLALILMDWTRIGRQLGFLLAFALAALAFRGLMQRIPEAIAGTLVSSGSPCADSARIGCGLHFMVGAFVSGAVIDSSWFNQRQMDQLRHHVLLIVMPVFFLSTGLRTNWTLGGHAVFLVAGVLLVAQAAGKLIGTHLAGRILKWQPGEASLIGWLLQTKALIMIIFANVLLDKDIITSDMFTALLLMAVVSTMLTVPAVTPMLAKMKSLMTRSA
jgi:Kef-type K+ transport systems, membrane components